MATAAQTVANQANAQHSTGPRTVEGKTRVAQNAVRHGLTATHLVIREDEREEFTQFRDGLLAELGPDGAIETTVFQDLLHAAWNLQRFRRIEGEVSLGTLDDFMDPKTTTVLDRLGRYQSRSQRAFYKALNELRVLQTNRALRTVKLAEEDAAAIPTITDINDLTKQTHSEVTAKALDLALKMVNYENATFRLESIPSRPAGSAVAKPQPVPMTQPERR